MVAILRSHGRTTALYLFNKKRVRGNPLTLFVMSIFVPNNVRLELISQNFLVVQMNLQDN